MQKRRKDRQFSLFLSSSECPGGGSYPGMLAGYPHSLLSPSIYLSLCVCVCLCLGACMPLFLLSFFCSLFFYLSLTNRRECWFQFVHRCFLCRWFRLKFPHLVLLCQSVCVHWTFFRRGVFASQRYRTPLPSLIYNVEIYFYVFTYRYPYTYM